MLRRQATKQVSPRRRFWTRVLSVVVGVPVTSGLIGLGYIYHRIQTRPPGYHQPVLIAEDGSLKLPGVETPIPRPWQIVARLFFLLWLTIPLVLRYLIVSLSRSDSMYELFLQSTLAAIQRAGPTFVKLGQWACTRQDLFSPATRRVLSQLYDRVDIVPFADARKVLEEDLGEPVESIFSRISELPIGSGSIGQVHEATDRASGRRVAVKVMHPGVVQAVTLDFALLPKLASLLHLLFPSLRPWDLPEQTRVWMNFIAAQLDFRVEAQNLSRFRRNFEGTGYVDFPEPLRYTQRVLIETFSPGEPATEDFLKRLPFRTRDILAGKGLNTYCKMLLRDNFLHGDLHAGNILIDSRNIEEPKITLLDVGLCLNFTEEEAEGSRRLVTSFVRWNPNECAATLLSFGPRGGEQVYADTENFKEKVRDVFTRFRPLRGNEENVIEKVLQELLGMVRSNRVGMAPIYANLLWSVLTLEGLIMNLNPAFDIVRQSGPWLISEGYLNKRMLRFAAFATRDRIKSRLRWWCTGLWSDPGGAYEVQRRPSFKLRTS